MENLNPGLYQPTDEPQNEEETLEHLQSMADKNERKVNTGLKRLEKREIFHQLHSNVL